MRTKLNFGLMMLSVIRVCMFFTRDVNVRCDFFLSCYPLCTGDFIPNPRNASVTENFSSLLDNCDIAIEIRSVMATCVECVSKIVISKSGNVHKQ